MTRAHAAQSSSFLLAFLAVLIAAAVSGQTEKPKAGLARDAAAGTSGAQPSSSLLHVYVGTYTDAGSRGIYRFTLDPATGKAESPVLAAETKNPSFLALHPGGRLLYAVGELESFGGAPGGAVSAFAVDTASGDLTLLNQQPSEGKGPCHLVVDGGGRNVLVANYGGGNVTALPIDPDGRLKPATSIRAHQGSGPNKARQETPHAHGIYLDAAERFAVSPDLGADRVFVYRFDPARGALEPHGAAALDPGSGPRHLAFHPSGRYAYVINELASTVTAFRYDAARGAFQPVQTVTTLPPGFAGDNSTAEVALSPDGRFLYGSNRGHDSLAVFRVDAATGRLSPAGHVATGGRTPRHFAIEPGGRVLLAANQASGSIHFFRIEAATGMPAPFGTPVAVSKPVCLVFRPSPR